MVARLFQQMFDRKPSAAELNRWVSKLAEGASRGEVVEGLIRDPEFDSYISARVNATLVHMIFLHRTGNADDINRLAESLRSGVSVADAINSVLQSSDYAARS
jgi:hypothetical protein